MLSASKSEWNIKQYLEEAWPKITWSQLYVCFWKWKIKTVLVKILKSKTVSLHSSGKWSGVCLHIDQMLQCSESVYSAVSLTLHHWHTQQSSSTWPSSSSSSGLSQRLLKVCGAQVWYQFISSSILSKFWVDFLLVVFQRVEDRSASLRVPQRQQLDQKKQSKSAVKPAQMCTVILGHTISAGTYRNLEKLLNFWFMQQAPFSQELHLDSVAVDLTVISLWPSVESRLKMLDIITVRVFTVVMCSHSDKESYKNLRQSESRWLNWSCSCSNTITHSTKGF